MEKRVSKRIPINVEAEVMFGDFTCSAIITDISENGLYLIAPFDVEKQRYTGSPVTVKFHAASGTPLTVHGMKIESEQHALSRSTNKLRLEITDPSASFKAFYRESFFKIKKELSNDAIAVIGMACYYPGAPDLKSFWENILARRREFRLIPDQRLPMSDYYDPDPFAPDKTYANRAAVIDGFTFDWVKRGIPKTVVESSDIVHWLALEVALRSLEDAGYSRENIASDRTGVILGNTLTGEHSRSQNMRLRWPYVKKALLAAARKKRLQSGIIDDLINTMEGYYKSAFAPITEDTLAGNLSNTIAGRICNFLDLHGGGYTVDGACSSSLIAVATAAATLSNGTLDLAIVGGVDISLDTFELVGFAKTNALTKEDMKVYDRRASGFMPGEGAGFILLKRLQNARAHGNRIYAILRGWGISSDGKGGMTAPKSQTQALAIRRAYGKAGYSMDKVDFIEGHGTGTMAGDKAELEGIANAMDDNTGVPLRTLGITSLKSLIGHTKAASGIGGFIKAVLAVNRRVIPPTAGCQEPSQVFYDKALGVYPVMQGEIRGAGEVIRAGVSGMGFGGINCHVTIESAGTPAEHINPDVEERALLASCQNTELFVLAAPSQRHMVKRIQMIRDLAEGISSGEMVDLSRHLSETVSTNDSFRVALISGTPEHLLDCLDRAERLIAEGIVSEGAVVCDPQQEVWVGNGVSRCRIGFLFPGQGSQQLNMAKQLIERYAWARELRKRTESWISKNGYEPFSDYVYRPLDRAPDTRCIDNWKELLSRSEIAQPAVCLASLLWSRRLEKLGVKPVAAGGHSLGELTAFQAAGAFDEKTLLLFAAFRGKATAAVDGNSGIMAGIAGDRKKVEELLSGIEGYVAIANINSPSQTVITGERAAVDKAVQLGLSLGIKAKCLPVSNAFHSRFMTGAADYIHQHAPIPETFGSTRLKILTSMDGTEILPGIDLREHFAAQVTSQVDFIALTHAMRRECDLMVEVGPGRVLTDLVKSIFEDGGALCFPLEPGAGDDRALNVFLGAYYTHGGLITWPALFENRLVRPFVPASKRVFIENPCENPLSLEGEPADYYTDQKSSPADVVPAENSEDPQRLFSQQQIDYIRSMISAEIQATGPGVRTGKHPGPGYIKQKEAQHTASNTKTLELLQQLASEMTGFPVNAISPDHRLLDNLNLDSIKAGQFVAKAARLYGVEGKLDPTTMANNSLREIFDSIAPLMSSSQAASDTSAPVADVYQQESAASQAKDNWVRSFKLVYREQELPGNWSFEELITACSQEKKALMVVSENMEDSLCLSMQHIITSQKASATFMDYKSFCTRDIRANELYHYFIFLLPEKSNSGLLTVEQVHDMAIRMDCIGKVITSTKGLAPKPSYAIVQFGTSGFYTFDERMSPEAKGSSAFLCSLHLENPGERIRVMEFQSTDNPHRILQKIAAELRADGDLILTHYDSSLVRHVPYLELVTPEELKPREIIWNSSDVVLVTGGARGITAECARAFAVKTGVKLALVGSSVLIDNDKEIQNSLKRYRENGITYRYYACDITDKKCIFDLKNRIQQDMGAITGVIHGAAVNKPRRSEQVTLAEALGEIAPKLTGALHLLESLKDSPPKLFAGLGSIIGVTGMAGNAWYAFSNEVLNLLLQQFARCSVTTQVITCAFSIWGEVGMGKRMGSLSFLSKMGILPIPTKQGVERFMQLMENTAGHEQVVVSSRLAGIDTIKKPPLSVRRFSRFLEEILFFEKGVEIEAKAVLTLEKDPYLKDHVFRGTYLLPTVFGLEAMAQAVSAVTDIDGFDHLLLEDVLLSYPITVVRGSSTTIHIRALVEDGAGGDQPIRVKADITVDQTGFKKTHFGAIFVLHAKEGLSSYPGTVPQTHLDIIPEEDLYGHMLFQGSLFHRIKAIRSLSPTRCIFDTALTLVAKDPNERGRWLATGDPFFRDTLLQSPQILLTDVIALPIEVKRWEMKLSQMQQGVYTVVSDLVQRSDDLIVGEVAALDTMGRIVEQLHGYTAKVVGKVDHPPLISDIAAPDGWDEAQVNSMLQRFCRTVKATTPVLSLKHHSGLHTMAKEERHALERELFEKAYGALSAGRHDLPESISIAWSDTGRPFVRETPALGLSCSHDGRVMLCATGNAGQGCDIEPIVGRTLEEWRSLLGSTRVELHDVITGIDKSIDLAGYRIWCALEALKKATDMKQNDITYEQKTEECLIFKGGDLSILTFPVKLLRGIERMVAVVIAEKGSCSIEEYKTGNPYETREDGTWGKFVQIGTQGQKIFACQFPLSLRDSSTIGGVVYFANYFHWLGKVREMVLKPIGMDITDNFFNGVFMVTNYTETQIARNVRNHEIMDARCWIKKMFGPKNSSLILGFEWRKRVKDGGIVPVALSTHQVSWARTTGPGVVEPMACPEFFMEFLEKNGLLPNGDSAKSHDDKLMGNGQISASKLGNVLYEADVLGEDHVLGESVFDTTMAHSNLAQNIYFSNYFTWQGQVRDRYLFNISPEQYRRMNRNGHFVCIYSMVKHLREAMPFDRISVTMKLRRVYDFGVDLYFEYFKIESGAKKVKLANADHTLAWVRIDDADNYIPQNLPDIYTAKILRASQKD
jgi:enediyne polyketide synthase